MMFQSVIQNLVEVKKYKEVANQLVIQLLVLRYRRTALGYIWTLVNPLIMMSVMAVVFSTIFGVDLKTFSLFLFAGMVPWNLFSSVVGQAGASFTNNEGLIKKVYLPKLIFPLSNSIALSIDSILSLLALFIIIYALGGSTTWTLLYLPVGYLLLYFFSLGLSLFFSVATVFFRDLQYIVQIVLQAWFFLTPILYKGELLTGKVALLVAFNPMVVYIDIFRAALFDGQPLPVSVFIEATIYAVISMLLGYSFFLVQEKKIVYRL